MGHVRRLWIPGAVGRLEGAIRVAAAPRAAAVVAHPHPLHGGTLDNSVIFHTDRELHRVGLTTLRFNFRGTGTSEGVHDDGNGEIADVAAAVGWLRELAFGAPLILVGYSFGSLCAIRHAAADPGVAAVVAVGLPLRLKLPVEIEKLRRPLGVVQGGEDELGSPAEVRRALADLRPAALVREISGAAHLFTGRAREAAAAVVELTERSLDSLR